MPAAHILVLATLLGAEPVFQCNESNTERVFDADTCVAGGLTFRVLLLQPPGCLAPPDDLRLVLEAKGKRVGVRYSASQPAAWWKLDAAGAGPAPAPGWRSACGRVAGQVVGDGLVLLLLQADDRPTNERLVAVLYDLRRHQVAEVQVLGHGAVTELSKRGVWYQQEELGEVGGNLIGRPEDGLPMPDGDRVVVVLDGGGHVNPVQRVRVYQGRIRLEPDVERSFSPYRAFFSTQEEFLRAVGWGTSKVRLKRREGETARGRKCVQFHADEPGEAWRTIPFHCAEP